MPEACTVVPSRVTAFSQIFEAIALFAFSIELTITTSPSNTLLRESNLESDLVRFKAYPIT
jgi:hypothetical protein